VTTAALLAQRVALLETIFQDIADTRMSGVGLLHPGLQVQAVDFAVQPANPPALAGAEVAWGVLITPWFMNLLRLPLVAVAATPATPDTPPGPDWAEPLERVNRVIGNARIDFLGAEEGALGRFEACSLFSPMAPFADQAAAVATAREVLLRLRAVPVPPEQPAAPARRGFLFGRVGAAT
jgi:[NiFe] hydrogenase assembly HybE family chaperone